MRDKTSAWTVLGAAAVGAGVFLMGFFAFRFWGMTELLMEQLGGFGGLYGDVTGSFGSLAIFFLFLAALWCQRKDLKNQQAALEKQGEELAQTKRGYERSLKHLESELVNLLRDRDEDRFYQLFHDFRRISDTVSALGCTGGNAFSAVASALNEQLESWERNDAAGGTDLPPFLQELLKAHDAEFGHYFRTLHHLLSFIDEHASPEPGNPARGLDAEKCAGLVRSGLSLGEMRMILCQGLYSPGLHALVERYGILESLPVESIPGGDRLRARYPRTRFASLDERYGTAAAESGASENPGE